MNIFRTNLKSLNIPGGGKMRTIIKHLIVVSCLVLAGTMSGEYAVAGDNNLSGPPSMRGKAVEVPDGPLTGRPPMPRKASPENAEGAKGYLRNVSPKIAPQQKLHIPAEGNKAAPAQAFQPGKGGLSSHKRDMPRREKKLAPSGVMKMKKGNMAKGSFVIPKSKDKKGKKDTSDRIIRRKGHLPPGMSVPKRAVPVPGTDIPKNPVNE